MRRSPLSLVSTRAARLAGSGREPEIIIRDREGAAVAYGWSGEGEYWLQFPELATFRLRPQQSEIAVVEDSDADWPLVLDAYHSAVVPLACQLIGLEALHASAVVTPTGVVGFCALSETGKSTLACALSRRGHALWTDDALVFEVSEREVRCHPLPFTVHVRDDAKRHFGLGPADIETLGRDGSGETVLLAALVLIERSDRDEQLEWQRLPLSEALPALLPHAFRFTLSELERTRNTMESYLELAARVPVIRFRFPPGLEKLDAVLDGLEAALAEAGA